MKCACSFLSTSGLIIALMQVLSSVFNARGIDVFIGVSSGCLDAFPGISFNIFIAEGLSGV